MSISPEAASLTTMPAPVVPPTAPAVETGNLTMLWMLLGWAAMALLFAYVFGAFRRRSIVGPDRLSADQSGWDLLIVLCGSFLMAIFTVALVVRMHLGPEAKLLVENAVANAATCLAIVLLLAIFHPGQLTELGTNPRWIPAGLAGGAATLFVLYPLISLTGVAVEFTYAALHLNPPEAHEFLQLLSNNHNRLMAFSTIALAVVAAPLTEELMYRGLLQTALGRAFAAMSAGNRSWTDAGVASPSNSGSPMVLDHHANSQTVLSPGAAQRWAAVVVAAAIFAGIHMSVAFFFPIFVLALGLGYIYERTGNLWITIIAHGLFNGGQIFYYLSRSHT